MVSSFFSPPAEQRPGTGLAEPVKRPRRAQPGAGLERCGGGDRGTLAPVAAEADRLRAAGATELDGPGRRGALAGATRHCGAGWLTEYGGRRAGRRRAVRCGRRRVQRPDWLAELQRQTQGRRSFERRLQAARYGAQTLCDCAERRATLARGACICRPHEQDGGMRIQGEGGGRNMGPGGSGIGCGSRRRGCTEGNAGGRGEGGVWGCGTGGMSRAYIYGDGSSRGNAGDDCGACVYGSEESVGGTSTRWRALSLESAARCWRQSGGWARRSQTRARGRGVRRQHHHRYHGREATGHGRGCCRAYGALGVPGQVVWGGRADRKGTRAPQLMLRPKTRRLSDSPGRLTIAPALQFICVRPGATSRRGLP